MRNLKFIGLGLSAALLSFALTLAPNGDPAFAQGKPSFAGKKAGGGSNRDAARAHALTRGKGKKIGLKRLLGVASGDDLKKPKKAKTPKKDKENEKEEETE